MKTLNRPMFRYGGPIKEGVMHGIREPKRNGGSMGTRKAALVGNPVYPQTNGRENHYINFLAPVVAGAIRYGKPVLQGAKRIFGKTTPASVTKGSKLTKAQAVKEFGKGSGRATNVTMNPSKFDPNYLGRDPIIRSVGAIGKGIFSPTTGGVVAKAARFATAPSSIVAGVAYYMWPDGEERKNPPPKGAQGGKKPGENSDMYYKEPEKELTEAEKKALENKTRSEQMDRYREIIDIKGMNKDAAYKSLIDASKIIQEGGNLKKSLKDGSLISKVTAAASKRFDKVSDTENALRSLVVKGEIDNELNKVDKDLKRQALRGQIAVNEKALAGLTTGEMIQKILGRAQGEYPKGDALRQIISINNPQLDAKVIPTGDMPTGADALEYAASMINKRNNDETTPDYPEGVYVIKDRVIQVIDGQVIPVPINKL